jgi:hypothetical protein
MNSVPASEKHEVPTTAIIWLMLFDEVIAVCSAIHTKLITQEVGQ